MTDLTIDDLPDEVLARLTAIAAANGRALRAKRLL